MFGWFKNTKQKCKHFKSPGQPYPENMKIILTFSDSDKKIDPFGYRITECSICGTRAFGCMGLHMMSDRQVNFIDSFIRHEITLDEFVDILKEQFAWYEFETVDRGGSDAPNNKMD